MSEYIEYTYVLHEDKDFIGEEEEADPRSAEWYREVYAENAEESYYAELCEAFYSLVDCDTDVEYAYPQIAVPLRPLTPGAPRPPLGGAVVV
jgi:hypothetical protein